MNAPAAGDGPADRVTEAEVEAVASHLALREYERTCRMMGHAPALGLEVVWWSLRPEQRDAHRPFARELMAAAAAARPVLGAGLTRELAEARAEVERLTRERDVLKLCLDQLLKATGYEVEDNRPLHRIKQFGAALQALGRPGDGEGRGHE